MEPIHYKILKILNKQPEQRLPLSKLENYFPNIPDRAFRQIISVNLGDNVIYGAIPGDDDFMIALSDEGKAMFHEKKYSNFINKRTLWLNRIISYIFGVLTTVTAGIITWLITSGALWQLLHLTQKAGSPP